MAATFLDPSAPGYFNDPYPQYAELRVAAPIHAHPNPGVWMVYRYDDVLAVLRNPSLSSTDRYASETRRNRIMRSVLGEDYAARPSITRSDNPDHTRFRRLLSRPFTPRSVERLRDRVTAMLDELFAGLGPGDEIDLTRQIARPLAYRVTEELLGMPPGGDEEGLVRASHALITAQLEPFPTEQQITFASAANKVIQDELNEAIEWKRSHPSDDLLTALIDAEAAGTLSRRETLAQVQGLFMAGHQTTFSGISLGVLALMRHRDQWDLLCTQPQLLANAVDELLRYDNTIQLARRTTPTDFELAGQTIPAGNALLVWIASANRDPAHWGPTADQLDITRSHLDTIASFGSGMHLCLGAWLARLEMQSTISLLARRFPGTVCLTEHPPFYELAAVRGVESLPLRLGSGN